MSEIFHLLLLLSRALDRKEVNSKEAARATITREQYVKITTYALDNLLKGYDKSLRPSQLARRPMIVRIDMAIRSMGHISETDMSYSMDAYFRQTWRDDRLQFNSSLQDTLSLGVSMLDKIWKPDSYFWNGQYSYLHTLTGPNKFVRLSQDGTVHFSQRLTIKARCPMYLHKFPMDTQRCPLNIGSYAYGAEELTFAWKRGVNHSVTASNKMSLSQFKLRSIHLKNDWLETHIDNFSSLTVHFEFQRQSGYFIINFYSPCTLIVILSWVGFWINREATADRIGLGVTSILTMTFLFMDSRSDLPRIHYATALDVYLVICYAFVLASILEFSIVHQYTKYGTGDPDLVDSNTDEWATRRQQKTRKIHGLFAALVNSKTEPENDATEQAVPLQTISNVTDFILKNPSADQKTKLPKQVSAEQRPKRQVPRIPQGRRKSFGERRKARSFTYTALGSKSVDGRNTPRKSIFQSLGGSRAPSSVFPPIPSVANLYNRLIEYGKKSRSAEDINSVSMIDRFSRIGFPIVFSIVSFVYWRAYLLLQDQHD